MTISPFGFSFVRVRFRLCGWDKCAILWLLTNPKFITDRHFDKFNLSQRDLLSWDKEIFIRVDCLNISLHDFLYK